MRHSCKIGKESKHSNRVPKDLRNFAEVFFCVLFTSDMA